MFGSTAGFLGTADRTALFPVGSNPRWQLAAILKISNSHALHASRDACTARPLYFALRHYAVCIHHCLDIWREIGKTYFTGDGS